MIPVLTRNITKVRPRVGIEAKFRLSHEYRSILLSTYTKVLQDVREHKPEYSDACKLICAIHSRELVLFRDIISQTSVKVWTDGSCIDNGKAEARCGLGIFYGLRDNRNKSITLTGGTQTNNRAELSAILYVLATNDGGIDMIIFSDSTYCINSITVWSKKWKLNDWKKPNGDVVQNVEMHKALRRLIESRERHGGATGFVHVRAHKDNENNNAADELARVATSGVCFDKKFQMLVKSGIPL